MPQSIRVKNIESYAKQYNERLINFARKENLKSRFEIGEVVEEDKFLHTLMMHEKLCPINCTVADYIMDKIEGVNDKNLKMSECLILYKEQCKTECKPENIEDKCAQKILW